MSNVVAIQFDRNTPGLTAYTDLARNQRPLMAACGKRLERELRSHFLRKNNTPNKKGWPRSNFWNRRIRANTSLTEVTSSSATVTIAAPEFAQKLYGGTIKPKESKYLALPARAEAANRSPRVVGDLKFLPLRRGTLRGLLVDQFGDAWYFLRTEVTQAKDPTALPKTAELEAAIGNETSRFLTRFLNRRAARA